LDPLPTRVSRAEWGDNRFRGRSVLADVSVHDEFWSVASLALGGPRLRPEEARVLDAATAASLAADPRIWPLKIARLVSAYGGAGAAYGAAQTWLERGIVGPFAARDAAGMLVALATELGEAPSFDEVFATLEARLARGERLPGFGTPLRSVDERVVAFLARLEAFGRADGRHVRLARHLDRASVALRQLHVNIAGMFAAACLDLGFTPAQIGWLCTLTLSVNFLANVVEGAEQAPEVLRRLPDEAVRYVGKAPRPSPRAR
jgi:hypothetical protein